MSEGGDHRKETADEDSARSDHTMAERLKEERDGRFARALTASSLRTARSQARRAARTGIHAEEQKQAHQADARAMEEIERKQVKWQLTPPKRRHGAGTE